MLSETALLMLPRSMLRAANMTQIQVYQMVSEAGDLLRIYEP